MSTYYKPSGKFSPVSIVYFILLSIIAFPILGLIYAYCIWYIPFIYLNFIIAGATGFAIGFLINRFVIGKGKVRNVSLALIFGLLGGLITLYFHWAVWVDLVINAGESYGSSRIGITVSNIKIFQVFSLASQPDVLFELIKEINISGTWGIKSSTVNGPFLSIIWIIELLIIVRVSVLIAFPKAQNPFCEIENNWFKENILAPFISIKEIESIKKMLETSNNDAFNNLFLSPSPGNSNHSIFTLYTSKNANNNYLSITNKKFKLDNKGNPDFDSNEIVSNIHLNSTQKATLLSIKDLQPEVSEEE